MTHLIAALCTAKDCGIPQVIPDVTLIKRIIDTLLTVAGALSVIFVLVGGLKYTLSGGDPNGLKSAKETILYALIGLVVSVGAFAVVNFFLSRFGS